MAKCPFCGSEKIRIETPFVRATGVGADDFEHETTYCCSAQKVNAEYRRKNFHPDDAPDEEDISKL